jgi:putative flippase GtrA
MNIPIRYIVFATISTIINLVFQYISFLIYSGDFVLYFAIFNGTLSGLIVKYILDKKFIFYHKPKDKFDDSKKFILYSFMGVFTTIIFVGFEIVFDKLWNMKYLGAIIGLLLGYIIKYNLDKKFVFKD